MDLRVSTLEENGGDDGNSSISGLELRVETLEGVTANPDVRLLVAEENIEGIVQPFYSSIGIQEIKYTPVLATFESKHSGSNVTQQLVKKIII